jgi:hypothetical protein
MFAISDVLIIDVSGEIAHRSTKHCVCISVLRDRYLLINTNHREIYDDFEVKSSDYRFLEGVDRFVCCFKTYNFNSSRIVKKVGNLNYSDMMKIVNKIQKSKSIDKMEKDAIMQELGKWCSDNC